MELSVNYPVPLLSSRLQLVVNDIDAGPSNGFMRLLDSLGNVLSSFQLARPSAIVNTGVAYFQGLSLIDPAAARSGVASFGRFEDSVGNIIISGLTVNTGSSASTDIFLQPNAFITQGQTVAITAATIKGN